MIVDDRCSSGSTINPFGIRRLGDGEPGDWLGIKPSGSGVETSRSVLLPLTTKDMGLVYLRRLGALGPARQLGAVDSHLTGASEEGDAAENSHGQEA